MMTGFILTRESTDGSKRYDACWRVNGKQKSKTFTRRKQAERYLTDVVKKVQDGAYVEIKPTTFKAFAERWLEGLGNVKPSTRRAYVSIVTHQFVPAFGDQFLMALGVDDVNAWLRAREGRLRVKTLRNHLGLLHKILDDAREGGYLAVNRLHQSRALQRPKAIREDDEGEVEVLEPAEVHHLLDAVPPEYYPIFLAAVCTGMRPGELLGVQWGDLDEASRQIHVRRTVWRGGFYVPKTKRSKRKIDVGDQLLGVLARWRRERYGEAAPPPDALIFPGGDGGPLDLDAVRKRVWGPALAKAGLRHVRIYSLRHTFASMLISQGENIKYISTQLGHASVQITLDRYGHLFPDEKRTAASRLEAQLAAAVPSSGYPAEPAGTPWNGKNSMKDANALTPSED
jgi:integrase